MSRTLSWGVALGATLLMSLTGCGQQPGQAGTGDVCGVLAAPVAAQLAQSGITATPVKDGGTNGCRWQDQASGTTITLAAVTGNGGTKDGQTQDVPGLGQVSVVAPGEVTFSAKGANWDLKVESNSPDDVDTETALKVCAVVGGALGGDTGQAGGAPAAAPAAGDAAGAGTQQAGTQQQDSTVTVTGEKDYKTDLRASTMRVLGDESITLDGGQTLPLEKVTRLDFTNGTTGTETKATLTDGSTINGKLDGYTTVTGDADAGSFSQQIRKITSIEFRRDTPFVATPRPQVSPWVDGLPAAVTQTNGTTAEVKAPTLRSLGSPGVTLDTGQYILFEDIVRIDAQRPSSTGTVQLDIMLVTGKTISGTVDSYTTFTGDAASGPLDLRANELKSIEINREVRGG